MTRMQIRALLSSPDNDRAVIVLEDAERQRRLAFSADQHETRRLGRALGSAQCVCNPIYHFVDALLATFQATITRVVLDDAGDLGIGAVVELEHADTPLTIACYPPDALALAVRATVPIYATARALAHAKSLATPDNTPSPSPSDAKRWVERVSPGDFR